MHGILDQFSWNSKSNNDISHRHIILSCVLWVHACQTNRIHKTITMNSSFSFVVFLFIWNTRCSFFFFRQKKKISVRCHLNANWPRKKNEDKNQHQLNMLCILSLTKYFASNYTYTLTRCGMGILSYWTLNEKVKNWVLRIGSESEINKKPYSLWNVESYLFH